MPTFFNPAANLTATRIPFSAGGGRLSDDSRFNFDGTRVRIVDTKKSVVLHNDATTGIGADGTGLALTRGDNALYWTGQILFPESDDIRSLGMSTNRWANFWARRTWLGTNTDQSNGRLQLASHTTSADGIGFYDATIYRNGAGSLRIGGALSVDNALVSGGAFTGNGTGYFAGALTCGADLFLGTAANPRAVYDYAGNMILRARSGIVPATLADVIAVLQYHGLCS